MRGALSCGLFRTFACGSFRSWTYQSTPSKRSAQKSELHPQSFRAFSGSVAQLRSACLPQAARVSESRPRNGCFAPRTKIRTTSAILPRRRQVSDCETEPPKKSALCAPRAARAARSKKGAMHSFGLLSPTVCRWERLPEIFRRKGPVNTGGYDRQ